MQQAATQFGPESDVPKEEKAFARQPVRKQIINELKDIFHKRAREKHDEY